MRKANKNRGAGVGTIQEIVGVKEVVQGTQMEAIAIIERLGSLL